MVFLLTKNPAVYGGVFEICIRYRFAMLGLLCLLVADAGLRCAAAYYLTASLRDLPALKAGSFIAGILIFWPGFLGFTPLLAALLETRNVPNPVIVTFSPFLRLFVTASRIASSTACASFFVTPALAAAAFTRSCLVINI